MSEPEPAVAFAASPAMTINLVGGEAPEEPGYFVPVTGGHPTPPLDREIAEGRNEQVGRRLAFLVIA